MGARKRTLWLGMMLLAVVAAGCGEEQVSPGPGGAGAFAAPITIDPADYEKWVWISVPEMRCADDSPGGFAVNFTHQSRELVVYLLGGGICYDLFSCQLDQPALHGVGADPLAQLVGEDHSGGHTGIFDRNDPENPLRRSNFVVLPHCTGDFHSADRLSSYPPLEPIHQVGYANVTVAIQHIVPTFRNATRVVFAGYSAGGIGVTTNYHQFATAFESVGQPPPILINDAGPPLRQPFLSQRAQDVLSASWGLEQTVGPWCPTCGTEGLHTVHRRLAELHPGLRSSVICAYSDSVVSALYTLLNLASTPLRAGLLDLDDSIASYQDEIAPSAQRVFFYTDNRHGATIVAPLSATPGLAEFLRAQLDGSESWVSIRP